MVGGGKARDNKRGTGEVQTAHTENFPAMRRIKHQSNLARDDVEIFQYPMDKSISKLV